MCVCPWKELGERFRAKLLNQTGRSTWDLAAGKLARGNGRALVFALGLLGRPPPKGSNLDAP